MISLNKEEKVIAILGTVSGKVPIEALCEFNSPQKILLWGFDGISNQIQKWAQGKNIEIKQYYPQPYNEENIRKAIDEISDLSDSIYIFHDYHPSSYDNIYHPEDEGETLDRYSSMLKITSEHKGKRVIITKLPKVYHHNFMIQEQDERGGHFFDIEINSKDTNEQSARGEAMALAQIYFMKYIHEPIRKRKIGFYSLKRLEDRFWREVNTREIENWFGRIEKEFSED